MNRTCFKCGADNPSATFRPDEACPSCGAIYAKVKAARDAALDRPQTTGDARASTATAKEPSGSTPKPSTGGSLAALVIVAALAALFFTSFRQSTHTKAGPDSTAPALYRITYRVSGTANTAALSYATGDGFEQRDVQMPWELTFVAKPTAHAHLSAQNKGEFGSVEVQILVNGVPLKSAHSEGAYKVATVNLP